MTGDIASELVAGVDRFLLKQIDESTANARAILEARFFLSEGLRRFGRTQSQAAGAHFGRARSPTQFDTAEHLDDNSYQIDLRLE